MRSRPAGHLWIAFLLLGVLFSPGAAAQNPTHTVPRGFLGNEGNARHWVPSHFGNARAQTTYLANEVDFPTGPIQALTLRPNREATTFVGHSFRLTIHLSSLQVPNPDQCDPSSYTSNWGLDRMMVLDDVVVQFPGHAGTGNGVGPWLVDIPITPFPYVAGRNLQIEWEIEPLTGGVQSATWFVDAVETVRPSSAGFFQRQQERNACPDRFTVYGGNVGGPGQRLAVWWYSGSAAGLPAAILFSETDQMLGGMPLPLDLSSAGFTGCSLYIAPRTSLSGVTDNQGGPGRFRLDMNLPSLPHLARAELFTQNIVIDSTVPGGIRFSDRGRIVLGNVPAVPLAARHLYSYQFPVTDQPEFATAVGPIVGLR